MAAVPVVSREAAQLLLILEEAQPQDCPLLLRHAARLVSRSSPGELKPENDRARSPLSGAAAAVLSMDQQRSMAEAYSQMCEASSALDAGGIPGAMISRADLSSPTSLLAWAKRRSEPWAVSILLAAAQLAQISARERCQQSQVPAPETAAAVCGNGTKDGAGTTRQDNLTARACAQDHLCQRPIQNSESTQQPLATIRGCAFGPLVSRSSSSSSDVDGIFNPLAEEGTAPSQRRGTGGASGRGVTPETCSKSPPAVVSTSLPGHSGSFHSSPPVVKRKYVVAAAALPIDSDRPPVRKRVYVSGREPIQQVEADLARPASPDSSTPPGVSRGSPPLALPASTATKPQQSIKSGVIRRKPGKPRLDRDPCAFCGTLDTPQWRTGPDGTQSLCNACGVRYRKGKLKNKA